MRSRASHSAHNFQPQAANKIVDYGLKGSNAGAEWRCQDSFFRLAGSAMTLPNMIDLLLMRKFADGKKHKSPFKIVNRKF